MTSAQSVHVELAGIRLSVRTDASKERVQTIVKDIEKRLRTINEQAQSAPLNRRLILAALMVGEDLMQARTDAEQAHTAEAEASQRASALSGELQESKKQAQTSARETSLVQQKMDSLAKSHAALEAQVAELRAKAAAQDDDLLAALERADRAESQAEETRAALSDTQVQLEQALQDRTSLSQKTASTSARSDELEESVRSHKATLKQLEARRSEIASKAQTALTLVEDSELIAGT